MSFHRIHLEKKKEKKIPILSRIGAISLLRLINLPYFSLLLRKTSTYGSTRRNYPELFPLIASPWGAFVRRFRGGIA